MAAPVRYHNWRHAFNVSQMMFAILIVSTSFLFIIFHSISKRLQSVRATATPASDAICAPLADLWPAVWALIGMLASHARAAPPPPLALSSTLEGPTTNRLVHCLLPTPPSGHSNLPGDWRAGDAGAHDCLFMSRP